MAVYCAYEEIDLLGAHLEDRQEHGPDEASMQVWFAYADGTLKDERENSSHRGVHTDHIRVIQADDGLTEILDTLADLPNSRIRGDHPWAREARGEDNDNGSDN
jgi:hypothetical protein